MSAPNDCTACDCIPPNVGVMAFYQKALIILCEILAASGGSGSAAVPLPLVTKAFGFFTAAYQALGFLDSAALLRYVEFDNQTDGDIFISLDGGVTNNWLVLAHNKEVIPFGENNVPLSIDDIYVKQSTAPTIGNFYVQGFY